MDYVLILKQVASWKWISDQYTHLDIPASDLTGKTVVLTGANVRSVIQLLLQVN